MLKSPAHILIQLCIFIANCWKFFMSFGYNAFDRYSKLFSSLWFIYSFLMNSFDEQNF